MALPTKSFRRAHPHRSAVDAVSECWRPEVKVWAGPSPSEARGGHFLAFSNSWSAQAFFGSQIPHPISAASARGLLPPLSLSSKPPHHIGPGAALLSTTYIRKDPVPNKAVSWGAGVRTSAQHLW